MVSQPEHLAVSELEAGASVNNLVVTNAGHRPIIAIEGDVFEGRWSGANRHQGTSRRASYGVRYGLNDVLAAEQAQAARPAGRTQVQGRAQGEVWERIRRQRRRTARSRGTRCSPRWRCRRVERMPSCGRSPGFPASAA